MENLESVLAPLDGVDWEDIDQVGSASRKVLNAIDADRGILRRAIDDLPSRPELLAMCEHPDIDDADGKGQQLDKIVLYANAETGVRVRLHTFWPGYYDLPHNHRWTFASLVLRGGFRHYLYGDQGPDDAVPQAAPQALTVREERAGTTYALHHRALHALIAEPGSVSLVLRGPAAKDRSFLIDPQTGTRLWHFGASTESPEAVQRKRMTPALLQDLSAKFREWDLF
ncbi:hypothetical protein ACIA47_17690 [Micromonospora sp. NPDC051227]|uniref:hypothetical protein n=1 Tax=Micromonospora sp. NPDC051227 TaxID=3364285 RepID=UPI001934B060|nr:hypothetical protein [Micromonospora sp. STR1s_5]